MSRKRRIRAVGVAFCVGAFVAGVSAQATQDDPTWQAFFVAAGADGRAARGALNEIGARWRNGYASMIVDLARLLPSPRGAQSRQEDLLGLDDDLDSRQNPFSGRGDFPVVPRQLPGAEARRRLTVFLEQHTGQRFGDDLRAWRRWIWALQEAPHPGYAAFKGELYARIDPAFRSFFPQDVKAAIRLDEIDWGGVRVNGIPPLRSPKTIPADAASWLRDGHVVFGLEVNREARAYPRRILAWHEMATDRLGGVDLTIVYCTLCGTVIPYESSVAGRRFTFGTSGLLYRSNKLMFDEQTRSLWSAIDGVPVVGPLTGSGLRLSIHPVVTTTWREWKRDHPSTTVLSLDTGFDRDYSEGAAYRDYFATDRLMFEVPARDPRLRNKAEVVVLRRELIGPQAAPVAIAVDFLRRQPVFSFEAGGKPFVVITSKDGANRIYERGTFSFTKRDADGQVRDAQGRRWRVTPDALVSDSGGQLLRVAAHRAFWFGWFAQHPDTILYR